MIVSHISKVEGVRIETDQIKGVNKKVAVSPKEGWDGYVMRVFELDQGGYSPEHTHSWPHIMFFLEGNGVLHLDGKDYPVEKGSFAFVPGGKIHTVKNTGTDKMSFICIVPEEGDV
ncbi:MAG: hypothetical protein HPY66_0359 [Firmicutes bacterium]|nr:hypothetical protein [Bacillota bacterium]MDI6707262.1 cupin domain-containing protein [Bacillota bacterium]